jgi:hypothetical protein
VSLNPNHPVDEIVEITQIPRLFFDLELDFDDFDSLLLPDDFFDLEDDFLRTISSSLSSSSS